jgi:hypothetical protein
MDYIVEVNESWEQDRLKLLDEEPEKLTSVNKPAKFVSQPNEAGNLLDRMHYHFPREASIIRAKWIMIIETTTEI